MDLKGAILAGMALLTVGCASAPAEVRIQGVAVSAALIETAEKSGDGPRRAEACVTLSKKLWERDVLESLRYLRRGAELRDGESCLSYLSHSESAAANHSQRLYARLFIEGLLRKGSLPGRDGKDLRGELYYQLCWAWRTTEPRCLAKSKQVLEALLESGAAGELADSAFIVQMVREFGLRSAAAPRAPRGQEILMYAAESAAETKLWLQVPLCGERREPADWTLSEANAWGGGSDRLLLGTNVLAFLVNDRGEPSFRGNHLWICNLGTSPVYLSSIATGQNNRELQPGREELFPLISSESTTGIALTVRHRRTLR